MSNTAKIFDIWSHRLASAKYRPGQILVGMNLDSEHDTKKLKIACLPPPKPEYNRTRIILVQTVKNLNVISFQLLYLLSESLWVEYIRIREVLWVVHHLPNGGRRSQWEAQVLAVISEDFTIRWVRLSSLRGCACFDIHPLP